MNLDVEMASEMVRLQQENTILKKALELATENCDNYWEEQTAIKNKQSLYNYFIEQAKESIKDV